MITIKDDYKKGDKIVLMQKQYSRLPGDEYLKIVLCLWKGQYVTWTYNADFGGYNGGHYFEDDLAAAVEDFKTR